MPQPAAKGRRRRDARHGSGDDAARSEGKRRRGSGRADGDGVAPGKGMATALERKMATALEQKMAAALKQKTAAALSRPCCWAEQGGNEVECLGLAAPLDGSERLRCSDCREQSWSPTAEDLVPSRDCLYHQQVIFYVISYLAMTGCWHSFSVRPSAWPTL